MRHEEDDGEYRECSADYTAAHPEHTLMQRRTGAFQRDKSASDECGVDSRPINPLINDVTEHRRESDFEREMHVCWIGKRVRHKQTFWLRRGRRFVRRLWQKQGVEHNGHRCAVHNGYPKPEKSANQKFR